MSPIRPGRGSVIGRDGLKVAVSPWIPDLMMGLLGGPAFLRRSVASSTLPHVFLLHKGESSSWSRGTKLALDKGDVVIHREFETWSFQTVPPARFRTLAIRFPAAMPPEAAHAGQSVSDLLLGPGIVARHVRDVGRPLASLARVFFNEPDQQATTRILNEIVEVLRDRARDDDVMVRGQVGEPAPVVRAIYDAITAPNIPARLHLKDLAARHRMSIPRLIAVFKDYAGVTPHQLLIARRFTVAFNSLMLKMSIADAVALGNFADQPHLNRVFKTLWGGTPGELASLFQSGDRSEDLASDKRFGHDGLLRATYERSVT